MTRPRKSMTMTIALIEAFSSSHCTARSTTSWSATEFWMRRFTGQGEIPSSLNAILYDDFAQLRSARCLEDARIAQFIATLTDTDLTKTIRYRTVVNPQNIEQVLAPALDHFFNHQTHHRGQAHALLSAINGNEHTPSFDLIIYQRETGEGLLRNRS